MVIPVSPLLAADGLISAGNFALSGMAKAVAALYGSASNFNEFLNNHLYEMQASANATIASTGRILEMAKFGFGLGYMSSVAIIAVGQFLLGNTLAVVTTVATAAVMSNPIAMTCGAVGAIIYGWGALSDEQKNQMLDKLAKGLEIGVELIKSLIAFVIGTAKDLLNSRALKDFKIFISEKAALFGCSLSDVTHQAVDVLSDAAASVKKHAELAIASTVRVTGDASTRAGESLSELSKSTRDVIDHTGEAAKDVFANGKSVIRALADSYSKNQIPDEVPAKTEL